MKNVYFWVSVLLLSSLTACGGNKGTLTLNGTNVSLDGKTAASARYYKGGFFVPVGQPNWSHDMTVDFTQVNYPITGKHTDSLCGKSGNLSLADTAQLFDLVEDVVMMKSNGPLTADGGVEWVEITSTDGSKLKIHLLSTEVPAGEYYASQGAAPLSNFLKQIEAGLATFCQ